MATKAAHIDFDEAAAPATPAAGDVRVYAKADGLLYQKDDAGVETLLGSGTGMTNPMTTAGDIIKGGASGTPERLGIGAALQHLRVNAGATALEYADPPSGGGGGAPELPLDAAATAAVGSGDLFGGTTLDGGWSQLESGSATTDRTVDGFLKLTNATTAGTDNWVGLKRAFAPAGDCSVWTKINYATTTLNFHGTGVFLGATDGTRATGARIQLGWYHSSGNWSLQFAKWSGGVRTVVFDVNMATTASLQTGTYNFPTWLRIKRVGTTLTAGISQDGVYWREHATTTTIAFTIANCGLIVMKQSDATNVDATFGSIATTG